MRPYLKREMYKAEPSLVGGARLEEVEVVYGVNSSLDDGDKKTQVGGSEVFYILGTLDQADGMDELLVEARSCRALALQVQRGVVHASAWDGRGG